MATTTNFGWNTPDDTDLVKDGALAIRTLGSAIDTSLVDLKGGTTGQVLAKASNTDMDFTWSTAAAGKVGQVISTVKSNSFSTSSGTYVDVTDLSVTITPSSATSKVLVMVTLQCVGDNLTGSAFWRLMQGSTAIAIGDAEGSRERSTGQAYSADNNTAFAGAITFLDSPNTTSATTYKVQIRGDGGGLAYVNRSESYANNTGQAVNASTITVMEIVA